MKPSNLPVKSTDESDSFRHGRVAQDVNQSKMVGSNNLLPLKEESKSGLGKLESLSQSKPRVEPSITLKQEQSQLQNSFTGSSTQVGKEDEEVKGSPSSLENSKGAGNEQMEEPSKAKKSEAASLSKN